MKKLLFRSILILPAIFALGMLAYSTPIVPVRDMIIPYYENWMGSISLDGVAEEFYGEVQTTNIFNPTGHDGDADFTAVFQVCWNPSYLYVLVEISDDVEHDYNWGVGNPWEFDNIELFLQLDTNTVTTSYSNTTVQLRVCRGLDSVETAGRAPRVDYGYYMEAAAAGGWIAEVAVPWTAVMAEGSVPEDIEDYYCDIIGFDFSGADSDNSDGDAAVGNRDVQSAWDDDDPSDAEDRTEDLAWNNTSVFGYVNLENYYCGWVVETIENENDLGIQPNPATESISIPGVDKAYSMIIYNMQGAVVFTGEYDPGEELDISGLRSGVYTLSLDGTKSGRFVKK